MQNSHQPQKRAYALVFEVGGGWKWRRTTTNSKNEHVCSFLRLVAGGGAGWWWRCRMVVEVTGGWWWCQMEGRGVKWEAVVSNGRPWCQWRVVVGKKPLCLA